MQDRIMEAIRPYQERLTQQAEEIAKLTAERDEARQRAIAAERERDDVLTNWTRSFKLVQQECPECGHWIVDVTAVCARCLAVEAAARKETT